MRRKNAKQSAQPRRRTSAVRSLLISGRVNVRAIGISSNPISDLYFHAFRAKGAVIFLAFVVTFLSFNVIFAALYCLDPEGLGGIDTGMPLFVSDFFFSVHTSATVGYGNVFPKSLYANILVVIEILIGILFIAVSTGFAYARFSRPTARIVFSRHMVIADDDGHRTLMFRCANQRLNLILQASVKLYVLRTELDSRGHEFRRVHDLPLLRSQHPTFALSWSVIHKIDAHSPLKDWTPDMSQNDDEIIVAFSGIDESLLQPIHARYSYAQEDIVWNARMADILGEDQHGRATLDYRAFDRIEPLTDKA